MDRRETAWDPFDGSFDGRRVIPIPDQDDPHFPEYVDAIQGHYEMLAEYAAERRMGA